MKKGKKKTVKAWAVIFLDESPVILESEKGLAVFRVYEDAKKETQSKTCRIVPCTITYTLQ